MKPTSRQGNICTSHVYRLAINTGVLNSKSLTSHSQESFYLALSHSLDVFFPMGVKSYALTTPILLICIQFASPYDINIRISLSNCDYSSFYCFLVLFFFFELSFSISSFSLCILCFTICYMPIHFWNDFIVQPFHHSNRNNNHNDTLSFLSLCQCFRLVSNLYTHKCIYIYFFPAQYLLIRHSCILQSYALLWGSFFSVFPPQLKCS